MIRSRQEKDDTLDVPDTLDEASGEENDDHSDFCEIKKEQCENFVDNRVSSEYDGDSNIKTEQGTCNQNFLNWEVRSQDGYEEEEEDIDKYFQGM